MRLYRKTVLTYLKFFGTYLSRTHNLPFLYWIFRRTFHKILCPRHLVLFAADNEKYGNFIRLHALYVKITYQVFSLWTLKTSINKSLLWISVAFWTLSFIAYIRNCRKRFTVDVLKRPYNTWNTFRNQSTSSSLSICLQESETDGPSGISGNFSRIWLGLSKTYVRYCRYTSSFSHAVISWEFPQRLYFKRTSISPIWYKWKVLVFVKIIVKI